MGNKEIKEVLLSSSVTDEKNVINYLKLQNSNVGTFESKHGFSMSPPLNSYLQLGTNLLRKGGITHHRTFKGSGTCLL